MRRPLLTDPEVIELAVQKILPAVVRWCRSGGDSSQESEIADDLREEIGIHQDGYEFCRELERAKHWTCDRELVDILDGADLSSALREMEKRWVAAYRVYPGQLPGNYVTWKGHPAEILGSKADGKYSVHVPALGHVKEGVGTHSEIVAWERIDGKVNMLGLTVTGPLFEATA